MLNKKWCENSEIIGSRRSEQEVKEFTGHREDVIRVTDPGIVPCFLVRDLNKLPSVTFDYVDVTSVV